MSSSPECVHANQYWHGEVGTCSQCPFGLPLPSLLEIVRVLRKHPLIRLNEHVTRAYVVGSFAGIVPPRPDSDLDILLEVLPMSDLSSDRLEERYRQGLRQYFMTHGIRGKADHIHPQWAGHRVDLYFTYNADTETQPKTELRRK